MSMFTHQRSLSVAQKSVIGRGSGAKRFHESNSVNVLNER